MTGSESERCNEKGGVKRIQRWMGNRKEESEADMGGKRVGEGIAVLLPRLPFREGTTKTTSQGRHDPVLALSSAISILQDPLLPRPTYYFRLILATLILI